jgi:hypothetical protein
LMSSFYLSSIFSLYNSNCGNSVIGWNFLFSVPDLTVLLCVGCYYAKPTL